MLSVSCNLADQIQALRSSHSISFCRRSNVLSMSQTKSGGNAAVVSDRLGGFTRVDPGSGSFADRIRLGSLTEDGLSYKEKFIIRSYEVGINKSATLESIANFIQEVSCNHTKSLGFPVEGIFGTSLSMKNLHLIWAMARVHIEIYKYPDWGDVIEIETWFNAEGKIGTTRDYILKDVETGQVIGRAASKWVMMKQETRRLQKFSDEVRDEMRLFCPRELRLAFPEKNNNNLEKIPKLDDPACYSRLGLRPTRVDLDMNRHVNNVTYIRWVHESIPQDIINTHELETITLDFRRECKQDDIVDSLTSPDTNGAVSEIVGINGSTAIGEVKEGNLQFLHLVRLSGDGFDITRGRTEWRRKSPR